MLGRIVWDEERSGLREERIRGVRFLTLHLRRGCGRWGMRRWARKLRRAGVERAVFPREFTAYDLFASCGIAPPDETPLLFAAAASAARCVLREDTDVRRVVLAGESARELGETAAELCAEVRYLALAAGHGAEEAARRLRYARGVAVQLLREPAQVAPDDLVLLFSADDAWRARGRCLPLRDLAPVFRLPEDLRWSEAEPLQLLAALYSAGALSREELIVERLSPEKTARRSLDNDGRNSYNILIQ